MLSPVFFVSARVLEAPSFSLPFNEGITIIDGEAARGKFCVEWQKKRKNNFSEWHRGGEVG